MRGAAADPIVLSDSDNEDAPAVSSSSVICQASQHIDSNSQGDGVCVLLFLTGFFINLQRGHCVANRCKLREKQCREWRHQQQIIRGKLAVNVMFYDI